MTLKNRWLLLLCFLLISIIVDYKKIVAQPEIVTQISFHKKDIPEVGKTTDIVSFILNSDSFWSSVYRDPRISSFYDTPKNLKLQSTWRILGHQSIEFKTKFLKREKEKTYKIHEKIISYLNSELKRIQSDNYKLEQINLLQSINQIEGQLNNLDLEKLELEKLNFGGTRSLLNMKISKIENDIKRKELLLKKSNIEYKTNQSKYKSFGNETYTFTTLKSDTQRTLLIKLIKRICLISVLILLFYTSKLLRHSE